MVDKVETIWMDGKLVPWDEAKIHVLTHSLHYGFAGFEGIRCYPQEGGGGAIFRLREHIKRLFNTAHICMIKIPFTIDEIVDACVEVVRANNLQEGCYIRPLVFIGEGAMGISGTDNPVRVSIAAWRWGAYLGEDGVKNGIRCKVSSYRRPRSDTVLAKGKISGQYVNSILAKREALNAGYEEGIMLDAQGFVCEGTGENAFMVEAGRVRTPDVGEAILAGITRESVIKILQDEKVPVIPGPFTRDELYCADEIFLCGTAAEVTPVREVDDRTIGNGKPGPITQRLQQRYSDIVRGKDDVFKEWLTPV